MNILFITQSITPIKNSGAARSSRLIYEYFKNKGYDIDLFVNDKKKFKDKYKKHGLEDVFKGRNLHPLKNNSVYDNIEDGEYDIIHQYGGKYKGLIGKKFNDFNRTKLVTSINGPSPIYICKGDLYDPNSKECCKFPKDLYCSLKSDHWGTRDYKYNPIKAIQDYFEYKSDKHFLKSYDRLFPQSKWLKRLFMKASIPEGKLKIIPNFYDPEFFKKVKSAEIEKKEEVIILYVGRLDKGKGVFDLVQAYNGLEDKEGTRLVIAGTGDEEKKINNYVKNKNLSKVVDLKGLVPYEKIHRLYLEADIFVHPCKFTVEAFNRTITEAGLSKNAMLVSDVGTTPEIVGDAGLIFEGGNIEDLREKLKRLIENKNLRKKLQGKIYEKISSNYSPKSVLSKVEEEYIDLVEMG